MPAKSSKSVTPMPARTRKASSATHIVPVLAPSRKSSNDGVCRNCNVLPVGSIELTSLLLVLVFSLAAVLFTSVYALQTQNAKIAHLQAQIN